MHVRGMEPERGKGTSYIKAGWLIDGTGGPALSGAVLEIREGTIASMRKAESFHLKGTDIKDYSHCTILPGLVDCHVHLALSGTTNPDYRERQIHAPFKEIKGRIKENLCEHLHHGVLALRDGGDHQGHTLRYKKEAYHNKKITMPYLSAGKAWHAEGRYGSHIGHSPAGGSSLARSILNEPDEMDHIKIIHSGLNSLTEYGRETPPQFGLEALREAVRAGLDRGLKTMAHANGKEAVRTAIEAGCHSIEHGFFMGEDNLKRMANKGIVWVPTLVPMDALIRIMGQPGNGEGDMARRNLDHQLDQVSRGMDYGITIAAGTDAGSPGVLHGRAIGEEIGLLISAGLSPEKAVQCATLNGTKLLDAEDWTGGLGPGMPATFIVTTGGPDKLPISCVSPRAIYVKGMAVKETDTFTN